MDIGQINTAIKSQENDYAELKKIWDNIKKDSTTRKTQNYIDSRREALDVVFQRALRNQKQLEDQEVLSTHQYLTQNYFDNNIRSTFNAAMEHLAAHERTHKLRTLDTDSQTQKVTVNDQQDAKDASMTPKLFIQKYRLNQLKKKISTAETAIAEGKPAWHLQSLTRTLERQFQEIDENHVQLLVDQSIYDDEYFTDDYFADAQENFDITIEKLQEKINDKERQINKVSSAKLPRITIPVFTGSYEGWNSFYDLFKKIIDDDCTISTTEKMQYLKTHVRGDAEKLIRHLSVNEVNYKAALKLLINRYKDERLITQTFIDKLLDLPKIQTPSAKMLRDMHDCVNESLEALKNQNIDISTWDPILTRIVSRKWDSDTNMKYEDQLEYPNNIQKFDSLRKFVEKRVKALESSNSTTGPRLVPTPQRFEKPLFWQGKKGLCWYCDKEHNIHQCESFKALNVNDRIRKVQEKQMCQLCLMHDGKKECVSTKYKKCDICSKGHATLLHRNYNEYLLTKTQGQSNMTKNVSNNAKAGTSNNTTYRPTPRENQVQKVSANTSTYQNDKQRTILLATALVQTAAIDGTPQWLRILCDQGSEVSLCTEETAQLLQIPKQKIKAEIKGIADEQPKTSQYMIDVTIKPRFPSKYRLKTSLIVLPKLTGPIPKQDLPQLQEEKIDNKIIADPTYYKRGPIDVILGAEDYSKILLQGFQKLENGMIAQNTEFGWVLSGVCATETLGKMKVLSMTTRTDIQLTKFWELEEVSDDYQMKPDDIVCEKHYEETTMRNCDGTYTVRLPFKDPLVQYGNTRQKAVARLLQLEKRLNQNNSLRQQYNDFMEEYLKMGHMRKVNKENYYEGKFYIPHQPVIREDALTTKLRCVFDASSKSGSNVSLNDNLHKGPRLQQDLATILLRWRKYRVCFMADVEKMYRFIKINDLDLSYQRILWRWAPQQPIDEYELLTVSYGTSAAPYLAVKTLQTLAKDEQHEFPKAAKVTLEDFYVDDILSGGSDLEEAKNLQTDLIQMLRAGGFNLRKWSSNSAELLENVPESSQDDKMIKLPLDETRKSLGVTWSPREDIFHFKVMQRLRARMAARPAQEPESTSSPDQQQGSNQAASRPNTPPVYARPVQRNNPTLELYQLKTLPVPAPERRQNVHVP